MSFVQLVEIQADGIIGTRIIKRIGGTPVGFHRTTIEPGQDAKAIQTAIDSDLAKMGNDPVEDWNPVLAMVTATHTPAVITAFEAQRAAAEQARAAQAIAAAPAGNVSVAAGP